MTVTEEFVFDSEQLATFDHEVTTAGDAHRLATCGAVERFGHGRSPVDHDRLPVLVCDGETTDVKRLEPVG